MPEVELRPPADREAPSGASVQRGTRLARSFRQARRNVFASPEELLQDWLAAVEGTVDDLQAVLLAPAPGADGSFLASAPPAVLDRMAAIDALAGIASLRPTDADAAGAVEALLAVARGDSVGVEEGPSGRQARMGDRFDAFSALASLDLARATMALEGVEDTAKQAFLRRGLVRGLVLAGMAGDDGERALAARLAK